MSDECITTDDAIFIPRYIAEDDVPRDGDIWPEYAHTMLVCIDSFKNRLAVGRIHTFYFREAEHFCSLDQMLFALEDILNRAKTSQRDTRLRENFESSNNTGSRSQNKAEEIPFVKQIPFYYLTDLRPKQGDLANFYIRVYSRRHSSMQGFITWHKTRVTMGFRSEMELIFLIRNVLLSKKQEGTM